MCERPLDPEELEQMDCDMPTVEGIERDEDMADFMMGMEE